MNAALPVAARKVVHLVGRLGEVFDSKLLSPLNRATMLWLPTGNLKFERVATPLTGVPASGFAVHDDVDAAAGCAAPGATVLTVAVKVGGELRTDGLAGAFHVTVVCSPCYDVGRSNVSLRSGSPTPAV